MTLLELCEPLFQYVCRLNRSVRKQAHAGVTQTRSEIAAIFADMKAKAGADRVLGMQYDKVRLPLIFFTDFMARDSGAFGRDWKDLANDEHPPELGGDEKFFDLLDEALKETDPGAAERLAVFYTCVGLGFTGWYQGQPEFLRKKMMEVSSRIRTMMELDETARICPEGYEHVNTADLVQPPGSKLVGIAIALVGLLLVVFAANIVAFLDKRAELRSSLQRISADGGTTPRANAGEENGS
jgi:type VI secretion system protein ImpK